MGSESDAQNSYPSSWEADVVLRDGSTTHVRPIKPEDADALQRFHQGQSAQSRYFRFFSNVRTLTDRELTMFTTVDHLTRVALVAVRPTTLPDQPVGSEDIVGVGRYDVTEPGIANVAFNVADSMQGLGLGSVLLEHLIATARECAVGEFVADVLPENHAMLAVFRDAGFATSVGVNDGIVSVSLMLDPTERSRRVMADREHYAEAHSMRLLLSARRVLLVGPGHAEEHTPPDSYAAALGIPVDMAARWSTVRLAWRVMESVSTDPGDTDLYVIDAPAWPGFAPEVPDLPHIHEVTSYEDLPQVDLIILACAADQAISSLEKVAATGARGVVVMSTGFGETGPAGIALQRELVRVAHSQQMRVVGPASYGMLTTSPGSALRASLATTTPPAGVVGVFCHSQASAVTLAAIMERRRMGVSSAISAGHRVDISENDIMQYWLDDQRTQVACLYLEALGNPRKFIRIARRLAAKKPVVVVVAGLRRQLQPPGHAVRPARMSRSIIDEVLRQAGVIEVDNTHQLMDVAQVLAHQPLPAGRRIGVLASSSALAALVAEAASAYGLEVSWSSDYLALERLPQDVQASVDAVYAPDVCDAVVVVDVPVLPPVDNILPQIVAQAAARTSRPTVLVSVGLHGLSRDLQAYNPQGQLVRVPAFSTPEDAVVALAKAVDYSQWRGTKHGRYVHLDGLDRPRARRLVAALLAGQDIPQVLGATDRELMPVAASVTSVSVGTTVDVDDAGVADLLSCYGLSLWPSDSPAPQGVACVVRSREDQLCGPLISFGIAGDAVDMLGDVVYAIPPLTQRDVRTMVLRIGAAPLLFGYRGAPVADVAALEDVITRVSLMADDLPELAALDLSPVVVAPKGVAVMQASIRLQPTQERADPARRMISDLG